MHRVRGGGAGDLRGRGRPRSPAVDAPLLVRVGPVEQTHLELLVPASPGQAEPARGSGGGARAGHDRAAGTTYLEVGDLVTPRLGWPRQMAIGTASCRARESQHG